MSIIVPARNEEALLPGCLESLARLDPRGRSLEIIVVDNNSTDRTFEIARQLGATVVSTSARTIGAVRNRGAEAARGSFLAFLDADCRADPAWVEDALAHFDSRHVVAIGAAPVCPSPSASWLQETWSLLAGRRSIPPREVDWLPTSNLFVRASAFKQVNGFDESLETCEDVDLCYRLRALGVIICDGSVRVTDVRLPRTLGELFVKEVWHGKNSYAGLRKGRFVLRELPSLVFPVVTLLGILLAGAGAIAAALGQSQWALWSGLLTFVAPAVLYSARPVLSKGVLHRVPLFLLVHLTYFVARAAALVWWCPRPAEPRGPESRP